MGFLLTKMMAVFGDKGKHTLNVCLTLSAMLIIRYYYYYWKI